MKKRHRVIVLEQDLVKSRAWLELSRTAMVVFLIFRCKCRYEKFQGRKYRNRTPDLANNGEIVFPYKEAQSVYGIGPSSFRRAVDELISKGFIDIEQTGCGTFKSPTLYRISERWRHYGSDSFIKARRPKRSSGYPGFKKGNRLWQRKKSTVANDSKATVKSEGGSIIAMFTNGSGKKIKKRYKFNGYKWICVKIA